MHPFLHSSSSQIKFSVDFHMMFLTFLYYFGLTVDPCWKNSNERRVRATPTHELNEKANVL